MITSNINLNDHLINGQFGVVLDFGYIESSITRVYVKLDDENAVKEAISKNVYLTKHRVVPIKRIVANIIISKNSSQNFQKNLISIDLSVDLHIHKVQGLTLLNSTVVSLELIKQRSYSSGQIYVAFSRSTSSLKLNRIPDFDPIIIKLNYLALKHYEYLRKEKNLFILTFLFKNPFLAVLNIPELVKIFQILLVTQGLCIYHSFQSFF